MSETVETAELWTRLRRWARETYGWHNGRLGGRQECDPPASATIGPLTGWGRTTNQAINSLADRLTFLGWEDDRDPAETGSHAGPRSDRRKQGETLPGIDLFGKSWTGNLRAELIPGAHTHPEFDVGYQAGYAQGRAEEENERLQRYRTALELIAGCQSHRAGDVVDIARMALEGGAWGRAIEHVQSVLPHMDQTGDKELPR